MRVFFIIISLIFYLSSFSQNLVPNSSFEIYTSCPSDGAQITLAYPWTACPNNDAEYFNSCATNIFYGVPNQGTSNSCCFNFQYAHSGNAFIGVLLYNGINSNYREYAQVQLLSPLQVNLCYYVEFYVNLMSGSYGGKYAVNNIACSFTNTSVSSTGNVLNLTPYIYKPGNPIISDTLNWVKISGIYQATGGEQYIVIGNFKNDSNTDTLNTGDGNYSGSGYFIDDVSVIPIDSISLPAFAGNDTAIHVGDSTFIGQEITNLNCNWYILGGAQIANNVSGLYVNPTITTYYVVEQNLCGNISYDTVKVKVIQTGIIETKNEDFDALIYPNPNNGSIFISVSGINGNNLNIELSDVSGKILYSNKVTISDGVGFVKTNAKNGIYTLKITDLNSQKSIYKKVIIQQ